MSGRDLATVLLIVVIWGLNFPMAKLGFTELPPILLTALRFGLVALLLVPFVPRPTGRYRQLLFLATVLGGVHFSLMFVGLSRLDSATVAIASQLTVPFAALLAAAIFKDYLGWRRTLGMAVAFAGVAVMAGEPRITADPWPLLWVVIGAMAWAVANIQVKRIGNIDGLVLNGWMAAFAAPQLLLVSWIVEGDSWHRLGSAGFAGFGAVVYMAVLVTIVGYGLWYRILRDYPVNLVMPYTLLVPVIGVAAGIGLLGEELSWPVAVGGVATILGVAIIVKRRPRLTDQQPQP